MRFMRALVLLLVAQRLVPTAGHGWLMVPTPQGGGGTGSGNASTRGPCGKDGPRTVVASYPAGQPFEVQYKRANNHGATGDTVVFRLFYPTTPVTGVPSQADFDSGTRYPATGKFEMRVDTSQPQSQTLTAPATPGLAVLQFEWQPTSGGTWRDCAWIEILNSGPCATNNGGCSADASCTGNGLCTCKDGFFGNGKECTELPAAVPFVMVVDAATVDQDTFTTNIATVLTVEEGRILYDRSEIQGTRSSIYFSVGADPVSGADATGLGLALSNRIIAGDSSLSTQIGYQPTSLQVNGGTTVSYGSGFSDSTRNPIIATAAVGMVMAVSVIGVLAYVRRNGGGGGGGGPRSKSAAPAAAAAPKLAQQSSSYAMSQPAMETGAAAPTAAATDADLPEGWGRYWDDNGMEYFYNETTQQSSWEVPTA